MDIPNRHVLYKYFTVEEGVERIIPRKVQRHQVRHDLIVIRDGCPGLRRHPERRCVTQKVNIHHLSSERRTGTLQVDHAPDILQFVCRVFRRRIILAALQLCQRLIDIDADFLWGSIVADNVQQLLCGRVIRRADDLEQIVQHIPMIVQLLRRALHGYPTALVERLVKDAFSI